MGDFIHYLIKYQIEIKHVLWEALVIIDQKNKTQHTQYIACKDKNGSNRV